MIQVTIPGYKTLELKHLVMDYNGTMACDGRLLDGVREKLDVLRHQLEIHVLTADTFGKAQSELAGVPVILSILPEANQDRGKLEYVRGLGQDQVAAIGNGRNDKLMLEAAQLGIALVQEEGACIATMMAADMVCPDILSALSLLTNTGRLIAGLRR